MSVRYFIIDDDDKVTRIPKSRYYRLRDGHPNETLLEYKDSMLRFAEVIVELEDRIPVSIVRAVYGYLKIDSEGKVNQDFFENEIRAAVDTLPSAPFSDESKKVIDARYKFARKRYQNEFAWRPSFKLEEEIFNRSFD